MTQPIAEKRRHQRYEHEVSITVHYSYDLKTTIKFQRLPTATPPVESRQYSAVTKNISVDGLCFIASEKLATDDKVSIEVYLPDHDQPTCLTAQVCWSKSLEAASNVEIHYETGVRLLTVDGRPVLDSIYYDTEHEVEWNDVLESIFGRYRILAREKKK